MFDLLNAQARRAFQLAHREAFDRNHDCLGTEHLLLGMLREGSAGLARLLAACQVDGAALAVGLELELQPATQMPQVDKLPLTLAVQRALETARHQAMSLGQQRIGPEHLLLGIMQEEDAEAMQALVRVGLSANQVQEALRRQPLQENRDHLVQEEPRPGPTPSWLRDPSAQDLDEWLTAQLTPSEWRHQEAKIQATQADQGKTAWLRQLRLTQVVLGAVVGAFIFADLYGWRGLVGGVLLGILVGGLHHSLIGALAGGVGGWLVGFQYRLDSIVFPVLGCAVGAFLGSWVGDFWKEKE